HNEAVCLFMELSSPEKLQAWEIWTTSFSRKHPESAIANYFRGDALARLGKLDEALKAFEAALARRPNHYLVLNARGVVFAVKGEIVPALLDFDAAEKSNPRFADADINR